MRFQNKSEYESPEFKFEEMILTEKIAAKCWGYAYAWYDVNGNGSIDGEEKVDLSSLGLGDSGCQGNSAREELYNYFLEKFGVELSKSDVSTNTESSLIVGFSS